MRSRVHDAVCGQDIHQWRDVGKCADFLQGNKKDEDKHIGILPRPAVDAEVTATLKEVRYQEQVHELNKLIAAASAERNERSLSDLLARSRVLHMLADFNPEVSPSLFAIIISSISPSSLSSSPSSLSSSSSIIIIITIIIIIFIIIVVLIVIIRSRKVVTSWS
jgi:hypothetical protein